MSAESSDAFFDEHTDFYGGGRPGKNEMYILNYIKRTSHNNLSHKKFLDIGGGSGIFAILIKETFPEIDVSIVDPSSKNLEKNKNNSINKYLGYLPNKLNIPDNKKFSFVLINDVLHHVTGNSIKKSKKLSFESLSKVFNLIEDDGFLMIREIFYESYLYPQFSRTVIFYLLKFQNFLRIKVLPTEFLLGLSVCFFTRDELQKIIQQNELIIVESYKEDWNDNWKKKALFLKDWGSILYVCTKK